MVPALDEKPWPTLGPLVCDYIEENLVFGPGDLRGKPAVLDPEKRAFEYRLYEVYPKGSEFAGRRRFRRAGLSLRKGVAKTEFGAWIAGVELAPDAPVRCVGWDRKGNPIGGPVTDPYIPLVAYTEEQSDELAYAALKLILELSPIAEKFDIGEERILRKGRGASADGRAVALAAAPDARDGARTTFQLFDETHRMHSDRLRKAHTTMIANLPKRFIADPWALEITTAFQPGENSVAEGTMAYARDVARGSQKDSRLFFFHRQASDDIVIYDEKGAVLKDKLREAVIDASGPSAAWSDIQGITEQWDDPKADRSFLDRVWLNRPRQGSDRAFNFELWRSLHRPDYVIPDGALVTLGFDGSVSDDSTGLIATEVATGFQQKAGLWERDPLNPEWMVPEAEVDEAVEAAFSRWRVWRMYADPPYWETWVALWASQHGEETVVRWRTNQWTKMAEALRAFVSAMVGKHLSHDGDEAIARHIGNAHKQLLHSFDSERKPQWVIKKARPDSPDKIDGAMASCLSWEARRDALTEGASGTFVSQYETREPGSSVEDDQAKGKALEERDPRELLAEALAAEEANEW